MAFLTSEDSFEPLDIRGFESLSIASLVLTNTLLKSMFLAFSIALSTIFTTTRALILVFCSVTTHEDP